jgi:hypothetical protein
MDYRACSQWGGWRSSTVMFLAEVGMGLCEYFYGSAKWKHHFKRGKWSEGIQGRLVSKTTVSSWGILYNWLAIKSLHELNVPCVTKYGLLGNSIMLRSNEELRLSTSTCRLMPHHKRILKIPMKSGSRPRFTHVIGSKDLSRSLDSLYPTHDALFSSSSRTASVEKDLDWLILEGKGLFDRWGIMAELSLTKIYGSSFCLPSFLRYA